jgi:hypothetical protein
MNAKDTNYYKSDIEHFNIRDNVGRFTTFLLAVTLLDVLHHLLKIEATIAIHVFECKHINAKQQRLKSRRSNLHQNYNVLKIMQQEIHDGPSLSSANPDEGRSMNVCRCLLQWYCVAISKLVCTSIYIVHQAARSVCEICLRDL